MAICSKASKAMSNRVSAWFAARLLSSSLRRIFSRYRATSAASVSALSKPLPRRLANVICAADQRDGGAGKDRPEEAVVGALPLELGQREQARADFPPDAPLHRPQQGEQGLEFQGADDEQIDVAARAVRALRDGAVDEGKADLLLRLAQRVADHGVDAAGFFHDGAQFGIHRRRLVGAIDHEIAVLPACDQIGLQELLQLVLHRA